MWSTRLSCPHVHRPRATGERGDLLDLIALKCGLASLRDAIDETRAVLSLPPDELPSPRLDGAARSPSPSSDAARRLFAMSRPILRTLAEIYLTPRGLDPATIDVGALRFDPSRR